MKTLRLIGLAILTAAFWRGGCGRWRWTWE